MHQEQLVGYSNSSKGAGGFMTVRFMGYWGLISCSILFEEELGKSCIAECFAYAVTKDERQAPWYRNCDGLLGSRFILLLLKN